MTTSSALACIHRLARDRRGLTTVEYTIVLCLIAALCVGTWSAFGSQLHGHIGGATVKLRDYLNTDGKGSTP